MGPGTAPQGDYGTIFGTVTDTAGHPIAGATITVYSVLSASTGPDGKYRITTVPIDSATSQTLVTAAKPPDYLPASTTTKVTANQQIEVDFSLQHA